MLSTILIWNSVYLRLLHAEEQRLEITQNLQTCFMYFGVGSIITPIWPVMANQGSPKEVKQSLQRQPQQQVLHSCCHVPLYRFRAWTFLWDKEKWLFAFEVKWFERKLSHPFKNEERKLMIILIREGMNILIGNDADILRGGKARAALGKRCSAHVLSNEKVLLGQDLDTVCRETRNCTLFLASAKIQQIKKCVQHYV